MQPSEVMMRFLFVMLLLCIPCMSYADGTPDEVKQQKQICEAVTQKPKKNADIAAEYVAGADVEGNVVAPADLQSNFQYPPVVIPITLNLAQKFGLNLPNGIELKPDVGQMEIFQDGRVRFNGKDISGKVQDRCELIAKEVKPNGQEPPHDIGSGDDAIEGEYPENTPHYNE